MIEIPPIYDHILQVSDWYFGYGLNNGNETKRILCCYDFKNQKWITSRAGIHKVIEWINPNKQSQTKLF